MKGDGTVKAYEQGPLKGLIITVDDEKLGQYERDVNAAIHPVHYQTDKVIEIIAAESQSYFGGQKTAEVVAKLIQNKVNTYLNE